MPVMLEWIQNPTLLVQPCNLQISFKSVTPERNTRVSVAVSCFAPFSY